MGIVNIIGHSIYSRLYNYRIEFLIVMGWGGYHLKDIITMRDSFSLFNIEQFNSATTL
jgi:hypothetical protein